MPNYFPPVPLYPAALDSDYTLFRVYNTTESVLSADSQAGDNRIQIVPRPPGDPEIWPSNGYATISGEVLYYDDVELDGNGMVKTLLRCARNLGGQKTRANPAGTPIRGFVMAEHHNQLSAGLQQMENFVGINFDSRVFTLDYRIRNLRATPPIFDDFSCPDCTLDFIELSNDPSTGILAQFQVTINGAYDSYRLDFGDGQSTTSLLSGTHQYAPGSIVDPVVTVTNLDCQVIQTPVERTQQGQPTPPATVSGFDVFLPSFTTPPPFIYNPVSFVEPNIQFPPIVMPCLDAFPAISIGPIDIQVPSLISITPVNIPSLISITPVDIPTFVSITPVSIPTFIAFGPAPAFAPIGFAPAPQVAPIAFAPAPQIAPIDIFVTIGIDASSIPSCISFCNAASMVQVDWGVPPTLNVAFVQQLGGQKSLTREERELMAELGDDYREFFPDDKFQVEYAAIGIPSEITVLPPSFPDISLVHDIPETVRLVTEGVHIPSEIQFLNAHLPSVVTHVWEEKPEIVLTHDVPGMISVEHAIPERIVIEGISLPSEINIVGSIPSEIRAVGFPESIRLEAPSEIRLVVPDDLEIPLVFKGPPIETVIKVEMPKGWKDGDEQGPCVMLVPCK